MAIRRRDRRQWLPAAMLMPLLLGGLTTVAQPALAATPGTIATWAGGTGGGAALNLMVRPGQLAARGPIVYIADEEHRAIRALDTRTGELHTLAGNGDPEHWASQTPRADGGPAIADRLAQPSGVAVDAAGRVYLSDRKDARVRRVDVAGIISTFAGGGTAGETVVGPATQASLEPSDLAIDGFGNTFIVTAGSVRRVDTSGAISTVAGTRCYCERPQEDILATEAPLHPLAVAVDAGGQVHIADRGLVLRIDGAGMLRRVAGGGSPPDGLGDGGAAASARLLRPDALAFDAAGNLYIADSEAHRVRKVDAAGIITTVAGGGSPSDRLGDGGPATSASLQEPSGVVIGPEGALYVSDTLHGRVRKVRDGVITTVAGKAPTGGGGDGGPAALAQFRLPSGMVRDAPGNTYVADTGPGRVRKIDTAGRVVTVAGSGMRGPLGDGGPATAAYLRDPRAVAVDGTGNVFISDTSNGRVRKVDTAGIITTIAGGGTSAPVDGAPATEAFLEEPWGLAVDKAGNVYFADTRNARVRKVTPDGTLSTFAGGATTTTAGQGDGGPATSARLGLRSGSTLAFDPLGQLHISDPGAASVRKVDRNGIITTVFGGYGGINVGEVAKATMVRILDPGGIAFDANGSLYVVEGYTGRVWRVDLTGRIRLVGGTGDIYTALGDGGPARKARIDVNLSSGLVFDPAGHLYVADTGANRIRRIDTPTVPSRVFGTGWNGVGQLGDGSLQDRTTFGPTVGISNVRSVSAGYHHSLAVRADGGMSAWGSNSYGQLGDGTTTDRSRPISVPGLSDVIAVAGGAYHSLALRTDGTVWASGWNGVGQVGDGTTVDRHRPVQVPGLRNVKAIAAGGFHSLALTNNGDVWAWGWNVYGAVGTGTASQVETRPVLVPGMSGATSIAGGALHTLVSRLVGDNHEVWAWGWNGLGQLGDGTTIERRLPVRTGGYGNRVTAGGYHSFAGDTTMGPSYAWGWNAVGQLGSSSKETAVLRPILVNLPLYGDSISAGLVHNVALAMDGSVITWGWNPYGAVGDGTLTTRTAPAVLPGGPGAGAVAAGVLHSIVVR